MKGFLKFALRFFRRPRPRGWTMHHAGHVCVPVPIPHGWRFVTLAVVCHVSPSGKHWPVVCSNRTGAERYPSFYRAGVN